MAARFPPAGTGPSWVGLYSEAARRSVVEARAHIAERGYRATVEDIRAFRQTIVYNWHDERWNRLIKSRDFFSMSGCRDLLFNVMEHRLTIHDIVALLNGRTLSFLGFELDTGTIEKFQQQSPDAGALLHDCRGRSRGSTVGGLLRDYSAGKRHDKIVSHSAQPCSRKVLKGCRAMEQANQMILTFRCPPGLGAVLPRPIPAVAGLPDWFKALPQKAFNPTMGGETHTVKKCPPFIDAMTYGFLIPLAIDLEVRDGEFTWNFDVPKGIVSEYSYSPIGFHDPSQIAGTPYFDEDRFIIKFNNLWSIEAPPGYSLLFTHPVNRTDLPFTTLAGFVDCDTFHNTPVAFPARWHDPSFNGVLPKGTPVAQCLPVKRESWAGRFEEQSGHAHDHMIETRDALRREGGVYRHQFRVSKR